ncbi:MAG: DUF86 domain-containing protein [Desulfobacula sp.]|jgi:uncharacterized protein with HEPN domain|nr:DUF86 domain-containing protein [Desulfobacula sp.]
MSKRNLKLFIEDILESIEAIKSYITDINSFNDFAADRKTYSATIREYIIIGEAISPLIELLELKFPDYEWCMIKDFRNLIVHEYFGVDIQMVWDITKLELDELKTKIEVLGKDI